MFVYCDIPGTNSRKRSGSKGRLIKADKSKGTKQMAKLKRETGNEKGASIPIKKNVPNNDMGEEDETKTSLRHD